MAFCVLSALPTMGAGGADEAPAEAVAAASAGLPRFVSALAREPWMRETVADHAWPAGVSLDDPFPMDRILPDALDGAVVTGRVSAATSATALWYFPLLLEQREVAVLVVDRVADQWRAVSAGYPVLAAELALVRRAWPRAAGYHPRLVHARQAGALFFALPGLNDVNLTPIRLGKSRRIGASGRGQGRIKGADAAGAGYTRLGTLAAVADELRRETRRNIQAHKGREESEK